MGYTAPRPGRVVAAAAASAVAVAAAAATTAVAAGAAAPVGLQAVVMKLNPDCDSDCATQVAEGLAAAGCGRVRLFRGLSMVAAHCPVEAAPAGGEGAAASAGGGLAASARDEGDVAPKGPWSSIPGIAAWAPDEGVKAAAPVKGGATAAAAAAAAAAAGAAIPASAPAADRQSGAGPYLWGRDRINQATLPLDRRTSTGRCYPRAGAGVHVFVVDSGCYADHAEFAHLVADKRMAVVPAPGSDFPSGADGDGHGTHVAATVAGRTMGVAPGVTLLCVKAMDDDGNGTLADVVSSFDLAVLWAKDHPDTPVLLSASLGGPRRRGPMGDMMAEAAIKASEAGVVVVAAAGNDASDACNYTPASDPHVIAVGNVDRTDSTAATSNWGRCVDVTAPGQNIVSADVKSVNGLTALSGTSMAAPHVTGLAALVMAEAAPGRRLAAPDVVTALTAPGGVTVDGTPLAWLDQDNCAGGASGDVDA